MKEYVFIVLLISLCSLPAFSQVNSRGYADTGSDDPYSSGETKKKMSKSRFKKTFSFRFFKHHEDLIDQYHARMENNVKKYRKQERLMKRPQYSDPSYFGHKRKPKIHPVGKRKFCEECGIVH